MKNLIVVVDDKLENLENAKNIPNVKTFSTPEEAINFIRWSHGEIACVLTDMCMPINSVNNYHTGFVEVQAIQPSGILVFIAAITKGIPVAIVTSGHSDTPMEAYFDQYVRSERIPRLHCSSLKTVEDWEKARTMVMGN